MTKIVLDTSVIIRYPSIISTKIPDVIFVVPTHVQRELYQRTQNIGIKNAIFSPFVGFIKQAIDNGTIISASSPVDTFPEWEFLFKHLTLEGADDQIIQVASEIKHKEGQVKIATLDKEIIQYAKDNDIEITSLSEIESYLLNEKGNENLLKDEIKSSENQQFRNFLITIGASLLMSFIVFYIYPNFGYLYSKTGPAFFLIVSILIAGLMYKFKQVNLTFYAIIEYVVGILTIFFLLRTSNFELSAVSEDFSFSMKLAAGLYVMVRGLDNWNKSIDNERISVWIRHQFFGSN
ncbi:PIN domain-containing protein [Dyadobacter frigoris]|uniref:PIN/TRAM domain-containing protein n=1 Tax=Dyadobacter frigoris TaxID=2576211 RepID=A0A4U6D9R0_9BACT|nr:PIN domain-containing protein [Dyadobacter frigoris]TKT94262.1 PIN/TRAM domain-containing protein [Dyadobacter frigoris]GLU50548.1 hypothetical protein Dfri01_00090 [Dyadobacter frigoris]